ncbi:MAG: hypothetical protein JGK24_14635 [Microcoleus sp. PH2017_29_MFU_D_A]|uniref:hypothetical protein n=1 Tax=unclassified Microcoleus TaxID=2642155 RepID=UPI001E0C7F24|nr:MULTISPECIES: hypothetical protein [unclassified Microcoleus]MCC3507641.1 hypothetical protein [Microcoleus sp. PH2017_17_BER_D_A]MCC3422398.1 hypothetical protein [Microcoleus sp. PH2017_01_SCD_O_A]MCC3452096.1 hypothetical protein [Microcoleus sp. PH2017_08_TRC_O_A]MCC3575989.1 hypothetical protein [Microcoleus sp. PH2017_34_RAT_O_A]MCC3587316.1 hypothetical protein [Microcoleus sp. PH2017_30_WIL_O_A]
MEYIKNPPDSSVGSIKPDEAGNDFAVKYDAAFQRSPDVVLAHADLVTLLATKI